MKENESNLRQQITDLSKTLKLPSIRKTLQDTIVKKLMLNVPDSLSINTCRN